VFSFLVKVELIPKLHSYEYRLHSYLYTYECNPQQTLKILLIFLHQYELIRAPTSPPEENLLVPDAQALVLLA